MNLKRATLAIATVAMGASLVGVNAADASTRSYRLSWRGDPTTTMVVGWERYNATGGSVYYGTVDHGTNHSLYPSTRGVDRTTSAFGMTSCFSRLTGLQPDTVYYFVIVDSNSVSARYSFRTAPDTPSNFSFVAGGDSRNNRTPRLLANRLVAKLRPLFVAFGGDYTDNNTSSQWQTWIDDWQETISTDGRMYPIVAARGNHDSNSGLDQMFDWPNANGYFALTFGGSQLRTYTLNSEISAGGSQSSWLTSDLAGAGSNVTFRVAQYHKPMRPHTSGKSEGNDEYNSWARTFYDYGMDLVVECDTHMVKRTYPIRPSSGSGSDEGFVRSDADGTVYIGEGCWGAPLRSANDGKNWTQAMGSFNQVNWIHVRPDRLEVRTIAVDQSSNAGSVTDANPLTVPSGLSIWQSTLSLASRAGSNNASPTADAGTNQTVTAASGASSASVRLDGRQSTDSDGTISAYAWTVGGSQVATGANTLATFAIGTHPVTLTVTDDEGATDTDTVVITVQPAPITVGVLVAYDFESGTQGWTNPDGAYGWRRDSGGTPSNNTGPTAGNGSTWYWYMETSDGQGPFISSRPDSTMVSPATPNATDRILVFYYHMFGGTMGRLNVEVSTNGGSTWNTVWTVNGQQHGAQTAAYSRAQVDLSGFSGGLVIRFRGESTVSSSGWQSDMAIDDVTLYGNASGNVAPSADAGTDQNVTDSDGDGFVDVALNGTGSADTDGTIVSYVWREGQAQVATGAQTTARLAVGTHTLTLTVTDDGGATDTDTVDVVVQSGGGTTLPPVMVRYTGASGEGWSNPDGSYGWRRSSGGTPSRDTGPDNGQGNGGDYWYMETSSGQGPYTSAAQDSVVVSPTIPDGTGRQLEFFYHMFGGAIGVLNAEVSTNNGGSWTTVWSISGQQHASHSASYTRATVDLASFSGPLRIRFRGEATASSSGWQNDIAVDTITVYGFGRPVLATYGFESDAQGWTNPDGTYGWRRDSGGTPSNSTGPTTGNTGAYYLYMETSNNQGPIDTSRPDAVIVSPTIPAGASSVEFHYHMYGSTMGILYLEVSTTGGSSWTTLWSVSGQQTSSQSGAYTHAAVDLSAYASSLLLRFRGRATAASNGWRSDMAVDDVTVYGN